MTQPELSGVPSAAAVPPAGPVGRVFVVVLPDGLPWLNSNQRVHHRVRHERTLAIREATRDAVADTPSLVAALAACDGAPLFERMHVLAIYHHATRGRFDPANWYPSVKGAVDELVACGLVVDDDEAHVSGPDMRPGPTVVKGGRIALIVRELAPGQQWPDFGVRL